MNKPGQGWPVGIYNTHVKVAVHLSCFPCSVFLKVELTRTNYAASTCIASFQESFSWWRLALLWESAGAGVILEL